MEIDDARSGIKNIRTGVPQGSILGPLLFIIYVNDINKASKKFEAIIYADDTSLNSIIKVFGNNHTSNNINYELLLVYDWLKANKLSLNISKTKYMMFRYRQKRAKTLPKLDLYIDGNEIQKVNTFDFLGVTLNETLTWNDHIQKMSSKISRVVGIIARCKKFLNTSVLLKIYNALILSRINYGILCWGFENKRIYKIQKQAIRLICKTFYIAHTDPLFVKLNTLKVQDIYLRQCLRFYYNHENNQLPIYFRDFIVTNTMNHNYNTRHRDIMRIQATNRTSSEKILRCQLPKRLNEIPNSIRETVTSYSLLTIKNKFKLYALSNYKLTCSIRDCYVCERSAS